MPKPPELIQTQRLDLHLIPIPELLMLHDDPDNTELLSDRDFTNPHNELTHEHSGPLRWRVPQVKADPSTNIWFIRWIVLRETKEVVGSISFHSPPDEVGMIEIGFGVCEPCRNQGFGKDLASMSTPQQIFASRKLSDAKFNEIRRILVEASRTKSVRDANAADNCVPNNQMPDAQLDNWYNSQIVQWRRLTQGVKLDK
jgi:hypothetical protein